MESELRANRAAVEHERSCVADRFAWAKTGEYMSGSAGRSRVQRGVR